jgi:tRNA-specific 2-thiouridylase
MSQSALQRTVFPVGDLTKDVVKKIALQAGLGRVAAKKETTGICFVGPRSFQRFISEVNGDLIGLFCQIVLVGSCIFYEIKGIKKGYIEMN